MSTSDFAAANKGPLVGLAACAFGIMCLITPKGGKVMSFGQEPDVVLKTDFYHHADLSTPVVDSSPSIIV